MSELDFQQSHSENFYVNAEAGDGFASPTAITLTDPEGVDVNLNFGKDADISGADVWTQEYQPEDVTGCIPAEHPGGEHEHIEHVQSEVNDVDVGLDIQGDSVKAAEKIKGQRLDHIARDDDTSTSSSGGSDEDEHPGMDVNIDADASNHEEKVQRGSIVREETDSDNGEHILINTQGNETVPDNDGEHQLHVSDEQTVDDNDHVQHDVVTEEKDHVIDGEVIEREATHDDGAEQDGLDINHVHLDNGNVDVSDEEDGIRMKDEQANTNVNESSDTDDNEHHSDDDAEQVEPHICDRKTPADSGEEDGQLNANDLPNACSSKPRANDNGNDDNGFKDDQLNANDLPNACSSKPGANDNGNDDNGLKRETIVHGEDYVQPDAGAKETATFVADDPVHIKMSIGEMGADDDELCKSGGKVEMMAADSSFKEGHDEHVQPQIATCTSSSVSSHVPTGEERQEEHHGQNVMNADTSHSDDTDYHVHENSSGHDQSNKQWVSSNYEGEHSNEQGDHGEEHCQVRGMESNNEGSGDDQSDLRKESVQDVHATVCKLVDEVVQSEMNEPITTDGNTAKYDRREHDQQIKQESNDPSPPNNPIQASIRKRHYVEEQIDTRSTVNIAQRPTDTSDDVTTSSGEAATKPEDLTTLVSNMDWLPVQAGICLSLAASFITLGGDISLVWMIPVLSVCSIGLFSWLKL